MYIYSYFFMSEKIIQQTFWQQAKRFLSPIILRKKIYGKFLFQSLLIPLTSVVSILFLEQITKNILAWNIDDIISILIVFFIFIITSECIIYVTKNWWWMVTLYQSMEDLFWKYLKQYIRLDNTIVERTWSGKLVGILYDWVFRWSEILADMIITVSSLVVGILFTMYMVSRIHYSLPFIFLVLIILFCIITYFMNKKLMLFRSERYEYKNLVLKDFVKIISSKNEILQNGKIEKDLEPLAFYLSQGSRISKAMSPYRIITKRAAPFLLHMSLLVLFLYISMYFNSQIFDVSFLVGLSWTFILMQKTIWDFVKFYVDLNKQMVSVEKLWNFFDTTPQIEWYDEWKTFAHKDGSISLQNISYGYDSSKPVFQNFNLDIPGNRVTALVWLSWGGKSTLVKLISGYIRQDSWDILVDAQNLKDISLKSYYKDVWYLTQEPSVFDGSIRENLLYAVTKKATKKHLEEIIKLAHCEFIYDLPNGLDTEIWERGVKLSGWQKQRLAIAKIFLKNPKIIILDEPTSALDSLSEQKITEAMHNLFKDRTVLVIAHRLQTVKNADEIVVIEWGEIRERWTHSALVRKKWFYKQMLDLQSGF